MGKKAKKVIGAAATVAGAVVSFFNPVIGAGLMVAGGALYASGNKSPEEGEYSGATPTIKQQGHQVNLRSSNAPIKPIYSKRGIIVGVNVTYVETRNPYLYMICEIGEGELGGIIRSDGSVWSTTATQLPIANPPLVYFDDVLWADFIKGNSELAYIEWYAGTATQVYPPELATVDPTYEENLRHTAYLYVKLRYDKDIFKSIPKITLKSQGLYVEEIDTPTKVISDSPSEVIQDLLIRPSYRGGLGLTKTRIDETSFLDTQNYEQIATPPGMTYPIATDLILVQDISVVDQIKKALDILPGELIYSVDKIKLRYLNINYEPTVMSFDEDDLIASDGKDAIGYTPALSFTKRPNAASAFYINPDNQYKADVYKFTDPIVLSQNQDLREINLELYASVDRGWVQILTQYYLERSRLNRSLTITLSERAFVLEPLDLITLSYDKWGWADKLFRVVSVNRRADYIVDIVAQNETIEFYNQVYQLTGASFDETNLIDPNTPPLSVRNIQEYEERQSYRLRTFTRWVLDFDAPEETQDPFWSYAEVWLRLGTAAFINDFNQGVIPSNITANDLTLSVVNGVLRVTVAQGAPNPYLRIWDTNEQPIDPNNFSKLRFRMRHLSGVYDPATDWQSQIIYSNTPGTESGIVDCQCAGPEANGPWITVDVDMQDNYVSGTAWKDMGSITRIEMDLLTDPSANDAVFEMDDISLGNQFAASKWKYITRSEGNYIRENVVEGDEYYIKFVSVNIWGTRENFDGALTVRRVIQGLTGPPSGNWIEAYYLIDGINLAFFGRWPDIVDLAGFELRRGGVNFNDGYPVGQFVSNSGLAYIQLNSAIPNDSQGPITYHAAPYNTLGLYGEVYTELVNTNDPDPETYSQKTTVNFDFSTGTFNGTERYNNAGTWCLRVDHTGGNLAGSWISPVFQFDNQRRSRKIAGNFRIATITSAYTFEAIWGGPPNTFERKDPNRDIRFIQLATTNFAPTLRAACDWGSGSPPVDGRFDTFHSQMFDCNDTRYCQITIILSDPVDDYYQMVEELEVVSWRRT